MDDCYLRSRSTHLGTGKHGEYQRHGVSSDLPDRIDQNTNPTLQVNGGRATFNNWMVDGADNVDFGNNNAINNFTSVETIAEFRVMMNSYSAEYGRGGGAQVNVVT